MDNPYPSYPGQQMPQGQTDQPFYSNKDVEKVEEVAEAIIDEKWNELVKNINKIVEWKEKTESRMASMEQEFKDLKNDFDSLHKGILGKVGEYDQNIVNIGTEIKAMERVFQKVLPLFTENVNELSRISQDMRRATGHPPQHHPPEHQEHH